MGVGEEVPEARLHQKRLDPRTIRALRQPAARRRDAEQAAVLGLAHGQLQPNAFVFRKQREIAMRGRRSMISRRPRSWRRRNADTKSRLIVRNSAWRSRFKRLQALFRTINRDLVSAF